MTNENELTPAERAVVDEAVKALHNRFGLPDYLRPVGDAVRALTRPERCPTCDVDGHRCGGCGHPVPHGDGPVDYSDHGPGCPGWEEWHLEQALAEYALDTVSEWMRIIELERLPGQPRVTWQEEEGTFTLGEHPLGDEYGRFRLKVTVETLPPGNSAQIEEMRPAACPKCGGPCEDECQFAEPEEAPQWVLRTWADVRKGDRVRLPGTEHVAEVSAVVHSRHLIHPASDRYNVIPADWSSVTVTLAGRQYQKDPAKPIEIELSPSEVAAIELLGWDNREGIITAS